MFYFCGNNFYIMGKSPEKKFFQEIPLDKYEDNMVINPLLGINLSIEDKRFFRIKHKIALLESPLKTISSKDAITLSVLKKHLIEGKIIPENEKEEFQKNQVMFYRMQKRRLLRELGKREHNRLKQLESWLDFNDKNVDYVSFQNFQSLFFHISQVSANTTSATVKAFKEKFSEYMSYFDSPNKTQSK